MSLQQIIALPPNRVRRNYRGGAGLDRFDGRPDAADSNRPEDWIASTVEAVNPGLPRVTDEGLARLGAAGNATLRDRLAGAPDFYLGAAHVEKHGIDLGFLVKLLDSSMRLHVQAHPTAEFAQRYLQSPYGKFETYYVLGVRPGHDPSIRLGFQRLESAAEWRRIVLEQDIAAMDSCFDPVPVQPGEVWTVPGGLPHAIGAGLTVIEVMEPTDLVVRCEFVREGIEVPPPARFMNRDPDFALKIFDPMPLPVDEVARRYRVTPRILSESTACTLTQLIGPEHTSCFETQRLEVRTACTVPLDTRFAVLIVIDGEGRMQSGEQSFKVRRGSRFFVSAAATELRVEPAPGRALTAFLCLPG